jgi:hypothetical protein
VAVWISFRLRHLWQEQECISFPGAASSTMPISTPAATNWLVLIRIRVVERQPTPWGFSTELSDLLFYSSISAHGLPFKYRCTVRLFVSNAWAISAIFSPFARSSFALAGLALVVPFFFQVLLHAWPGRVFIITYRKDQGQAEADVQKFGIRYDEVILVNSFAAKAKVIAERGISFYVDDQDEMTGDIPEAVKVFKIRNGGNFDFDEKKWLYSEKTGMQI